MLLKLVKSPLKEEAHEGHSLIPTRESEEPASEHKQQIAPVETNASVLPFENNDEAIHDTPAFRHHAEATSNELFYDLFFVANLTTFTNNHEVNSLSGWWF